MGKRAGKPWEPNTTKGFAYIFNGRDLGCDISTTKTRPGSYISRTIPARIIRERDYQKLLRLASKNRGNGK